MADLHKKLINSLRVIYPDVGGTNPDMTTLLQRKLGQDRQLSTSASGATSPTDDIIVRGADITGPLRNYLRDVSD